MHAENTNLTYFNIHFARTLIMKKILFLIAFTVMNAMSVSAQDELKNEVGVFYGYGSASDVLSVFSSMFSAAAGSQSSWFGPIGVEYYHHISPAVAIGGVATYAKCTAEDEKTKKKDLKENYITVMPSVKFNWLRKKGFGMYSSLSAGVMIASISCEDDVKTADPNAKDETLARFMLHVTALGAEFGGDAFRGFVEAGVGEKGIINAGLRYKF